jgi:hypothetical protein
LLFGRHHVDDADGDHVDVMPMLIPASELIRPKRNSS